MNESGPPRDHDYQSGADEHDTDKANVVENIKSRSAWMRVFFIIVVLVLWSVSRIVLGAVVVFQICYVLLTGSAHRPLVKLGESLAAYSYEIVMYLTFNTDVRPFPFDAGWPTPASNESSEANEDAEPEETSS